LTKPSEDWYQRLGVRNRSLLQGDILRQCPIPLLPEALNLTVLPRKDESKRAVRLSIETYDVIVLSQSCDIATNKLNSILLCPVWPVETLPDLVLNPAKPENKMIVGDKAYINRLNAIRIGVEPRFHLLNGCTLPGLEHPFLLVDFWTIYNVPKPHLIKMAARTQPRLRLNPPYVEHLSQAFARFFMRVGLPTTIPEFKK